ncbi:MAG: 23S rRNA (guanosine(2251)-2'-O)-methyltransferase RlmB [Proteobacteria bacterium]|nr:23S rRNA (guanosine(2251)-2'-O)-methyltransferase RlmB [Pseudomonadota bacterium]
MNTISSLSAIHHLLLYRPTAIKKLIIFIQREKASSRVLDLIVSAEEQGIAIDFQPTPKKRHTETFEPVIAQVQPFQFSEFKPFLETMQKKPRASLLALDHLQDPQNFGALCRTAEGLGWDGIVIPKDRSVTVSSGVYNSSVGAVETLPIIQVVNLAEGLRKLKDSGFWIVGTSLGEKTQTLEQLPPLEKVVLVLGTEFEGISPLIAKTCDFLVQIPLKGKVQSLNVSATGAILMHSLSPKS